MHWRSEKAHDEKKKRHTPIETREGRTELISFMENELGEGTIPETASLKIDITGREGGGGGFSYPKTGRK